jgi:hypothetical protein
MNRCGLVTCQLRPAATWAAGPGCREERDIVTDACGDSRSSSTPWSPRHAHEWHWSPPFPRELATLSCQCHIPIVQAYPHCLLHTLILSSNMPCPPESSIQIACEFMSDYDSNLLAISNVTINEEAHIYEDKRITSWTDTLSALIPPLPTPFCLSQMTHGSPLSSGLAQVQQHQRALCRVVRSGAFRWHVLVLGRRVARLTW